MHKFSGKISKFDGSKDRKRYLKYLQSWNFYIFHPADAPLYYDAHEGKGKGLDTCYSATYMSQIRDQQWP